jgi:hypothetical protein
MAVVLELSRPKTSVTNAVNASIAAGTVVETDTSQEESFFIPFNLSGQDPPSFTVASCTTTSGVTAVTTTASFVDVRVGDPVTGTGIAGGTTVAAISSNTSLTLSAAATASGTVTLTFDPAAVSAATVYALKVTHAKSGNTFSMNLTLYTYDGSLGGTAGTSANATQTVQMVPVTGSAQIDIDAFLSKLRVPRSA